MPSTRYEFFANLFLHGEDSPFLLLDGDKTIHYSEFFERAVRLLNHLVRQGARHGDRVIIGLENRPEYLELILALALGGMTACPVDPAVSVVQLDKAKRVANATMAITSYDQLAYALDTSIPDCVHQGGMSDPFLVVFSSGTTGAPKGIVQSLENFFAAAKAFAGAVGLQPGQVTLHNWPMFYNAGLFNLFACPLLSGGVIAVGKRFAAKNLGDFWADLARFRPDSLYLSPTMAATLAKTYRFFSADLEPLQRARIISTSSILYPAIKEEFLRVLGAPLLPCFGITELGGSFTIGDADSGPFSVGKVMADVGVQIDDQADGELLVQSPYMALGYLAEGGGIDYFDRRQPFRTGDLGHVRDGELYISGRKKDSIKKGGEMINLAEVEDMVHATQLCEECYAVGKPDLFWGETYDVFFVPPAGGNAQAIKDELSRLFNASLPQSQRPDQIHAVSEVPRTSSGKPIKRLISYEVAQ
ncbi:class I adenylate-forming enzyme family protein [Pseudogulbenkiania ferrooxidans]|uniref:AMP-dependent synthetase and ligase n=1 Tax=Pseudogulbenkiania ferrooxidans 2002 TaxID=279714 RepID=B9Z893_9NEIS|nr:class I adenylate-forming enzyme family protein [Pseudogulbenkiania ferrooxidans]EEG06996.1 AMP-dependent synthetase and ligase [Pseudogulbenkiania ferrooxidans 2002]